MTILERRIEAKKQLEKQLKMGTKPNRGTTKEKKDSPRIPLTEKDIKRIKTRVYNLQTKILSTNQEIIGD